MRLRHSDYESDALGSFCSRLEVLLWGIRCVAHFGAISLFSRPLTRIPVPKNGADVSQVVQNLMEGHRNASDSATSEPG